MNVLEISKDQSQIPLTVVCHDRHIPQANTWVQLLVLPHSWSHDEALLLCAESEGKWVAWVPGYGETLLDRSQFCSLASVLGWVTCRRNV